MKRTIGAVALTLLLSAVAQAQNNNCIYESTTNCTTATGEPFTISGSGWPYGCVGEQITITARPTLGLAGLQILKATNEDCSTPIETNALTPSRINSYRWEATGAAGTNIIASGTNLQADGIDLPAVFTETNCGTGTITFNMTYVEPCGGATTNVSLTTNYTVVGVASLAPTNNPDCTLMNSNATLRIWSVPVSTVGATNLEIIATSTPNLPLSSLPAGWSLDGMRTNVTNVSITAPAFYTIVCTAGTSVMTNMIWVTPPAGDVEESCSTNGPDLLGYWSFNGSSPWVGNDGQQPLTDYGLRNPPSPWGHALQIDTNTSAVLTYNYINTDGLQNINCINGAVSFWFKPDWSVGTNLSDMIAPVGQFLELGDPSSSGWWSLYVDASAAMLAFQTQSNGDSTVYLSYSITNWTSNDWYQVVLDYSTNETSLYINGVLAETGPGMTNYPDITDRMAYGFSIGSDHNAQSQIRGTIDEVYTFDCPLTAHEVATGFPGYGGYPGTNENPAPSILTQPSSQTVNDGGSATFSVTAIGAPPLSYQWSFSGTTPTGPLISGPTGYSQGGGYPPQAFYTYASFPVVAGMSYVITIGPDEIGWWNPGFTAPARNWQPGAVQGTTNATVVATGNWITFKGIASLAEVGLAVTATVEPVSGATSISGATNSIFVISNVQATNAGNYVVVVSNVEGSVTSSNATLNVQSCSFQNGSFEYGFTGWSHDADAQVIPGSPLLQPTDGRFYAELYNWSQGGDGGTISQTICVDPGSNYQVSYEYAAVLPSGGSLPSQTVATLSVEVTADDQCIYFGAPNPTSSWQTNTFEFHVPIDANTVTLTFFRDLSTNEIASGASAFYLPSAVDNVVFQELANSHLPVITIQPQSQTQVANCDGNSLALAFSLTAVGSDNLTYQWQVNGGQVLPGNTYSSGNVLAFYGLSAQDNGTYNVIVTSASGQVCSSDATLTVIDPAILGQPSSIGVNVGQTWSLSVNACGTGLPALGGVSYQWYKNGQPLTWDSATDWSLQPPNSASLSDAGPYYCVITGAYGSITSEVATVTVFCPQPYITSQPQSTVACLGSNIAFSVTALASPGDSLTYQWYANGQIIQPATGSTYTISSVSASDYATYTVMITNSEGIVVTSTPAILYPPPSLTEGTVAVAIDNGTIMWFLPDGTPKYLLADTTGQWNDVAADMCFDSAGDIISDYINIFALSQNDLCSFSTWIRPVPPQPSMLGPTAVALDAAGNTYVATGTGNGWGIMEFDTNGNFIRGYLTNTPVRVMDLDADQTNIFYIPVFNLTPTNIFKLPVGGATGNPVLFSALNDDDGIGYPFCLRILPDGSVLVADGLSVKWNTTNGTVAIWDTDINVWPFSFYAYSISLDPTGSSFWVSEPYDAGGPYGEVLHFDLGTGDFANPPGFCTGSDNQGALAVIGDLRMGRLIIQQPLTQTICPGGSARFTVAVCQRFPYSVSYAWYQNGTNKIPGATNASFTTDVPGIYTVLLTSTNDPVAINVLSSPAALIIGAPTIDHQPVSQSLLVGAEVDFTVDAEGYGLTYQWYKNGSAISGATTSEYSITNVSTNDAGTYCVIVGSCSNADRTTSASAILTVREPEPAGFFSGMVDRWPGEGNANDIIGGNNGSLSDIGFDVGEVGLAFCFYGNSSVDIANIDHNCTAAGEFGLNDFSVEFWVQSTAIQNEQLVWASDFYGSPSNQWQIKMISGFVSVVLAGSSNPVGYPAYPFSLTGTNVVNDGVFHHVVVTRLGLTISIYVDESLSAQASTPGIANLTWSCTQLMFGNGNPLDPDVYPFVGKLDEITFYDRALTAAEVQLAFTEGSNGKLPRLGLVMFNATYPCQEYDIDNGSQEIYLSVPGNSGTTIYYTTDGTTPTTASIPYATPLFVAEVDGEPYPPTYITAIAVEAGYVSSPPSSYILGLGAPTITLQPISQTVQENDAPDAPPIEFAVVVQSPAPLQTQSDYGGCGNPLPTTNLLCFGGVSYQWYLNGSPIFEATNSILSVSPVAANAGSYFVICSNAAGTTFSTLATLQVGSVVPTVPLGEIISWWPGYIDNSGVADVVGPNNGQPYPFGAPLYSAPGYLGQALSFTDPQTGDPAINDAVLAYDVANSGLDPASFSIEAWVYLNDAREQFPRCTSGWRVVLEKGANQSQYVYLNGYVNPLTPGIQYQLAYSPLGLQGTIGNSVCSATVSLTPAQWHYVAMTYDGVSTICLYLDGSPCGSANNVSPAAPTADPVFLGGANGSGDLLNQIILYNTVLSAQTIQQHSASLYGINSTILITAQPQNQQGCSNNFGSLCVTAQGQSPLTYRWLQNGEDLPDSLLENCYTPASSGTYTVIIYDAAGNSLQSAPAVVTSSSQPPAIIAQAPTVFATPGGTATLCTFATGDNLTYQWQYQSQNISNATNAFFTIPNVQPSQAGMYTVMVANGCGSTSGSTELVLAAGNAVTWDSEGDLQLPLNPTVDNDITAVSVGNPQYLALKSDGTVAEWTASSQVTHSHSGITAIAAGSNYNLYLTQSGSVLADGNDGGSGTASPPSSVAVPPANGPTVVAISAGQAHALALMSDSTVIGWGKGSEANAAGLTNIVAVSAGSLHSLVLRGDGTVYSWGNNAPSGLPAGLSNVVAIAAGSNYDLALQANGSVVAWGDDTYGVTNIPQNLSNVIQIAAGAQYSVALMDTGSVVVWGSGAPSSPFDLQAVAAITAGAASPLAITVAPVITTQPVEWTFCYPWDNSVTLSVTAANVSSSSPLTYDWQMEGQDLGPGGSSYTINVQSNGEYFVIVSNDYASTTSAPLSMVFVWDSPPVILSPVTPVTETVWQGDSVTFGVAVLQDPVRGTATYQWQLNGTNLSGATSEIYIINSAQPSDAGTYTILVSCNGQTVQSVDMDLTVLLALQITSQPQNQSPIVGQNVIFTVGAIGGTAPLSYEWYWVGDGQTNLIGDDSALEIDNVVLAYDGVVYVVITDALGVEVTSQQATLTVTSVSIPAPSGMVAWWRAEGNANDSAGTNNATSWQVTYTNGEVGHAFSFYGISDYVTIPDSPSLELTNGSFTIEGWICPYSDDHVGYEVIPGFIIDHGDNSQGSYGITFEEDGNNLSGWSVEFWIGADDGTYEGLSYPVALDQWQHIAGVFDAGAMTMTLYINGQIYSDYWYPNPVSVTNTPADDLTGAAVGIGNCAQGDPTLYPFCGLIDELTIYTNALDQDYIEAIYNAASQGKFVPGVSTPSLTEGMSLPPDGNGGSTISVPVTVQGPLASLLSITLYADGQPFTPVVVLEPPFSVPLSLVVDTAYLPNGIHSLYAIAEWNTPLGDADGPVETSSPAIDVIVYNPISYPDFVDVFTYGGQMTFNVVSAETNVDWELDVYDSQTNLIQSFTGNTPDGNINVLWDGTDGNGYTYPDPFFSATVTTYPLFGNSFMAIPAAQGGPHFPTPKKNLIFGNWPDGPGKWVVDWGNYWYGIPVDGLNPLNPNSEIPVTMDNVMNTVQVCAQDNGGLFNNNSTVGLLRDYGPGNTVIIPHSQVVNAWATLFTDLQASEVHDFYYCGHSWTDHIGAYHASTNMMITTKQLAKALHTEKPNDPLRHVYRFVFIDGCLGGTSAAFPHAFGMQGGSRAMSEQVAYDGELKTYDLPANFFQDYANHRWAYIGWSQEKAFANKLSGMVGTYPGFRNEFFYLWDSGSYSIQSAYVHAVTQSEPSSSIVYGWTVYGDDSMTGSSF
jgi:hypothetical protein